MTQVLTSFEDPFHAECVDIFRRADGSFGFELFRAESDGGRRWQSLGRFGHLVFASGEDALSDAKRYVSWLGDVGPWRW